MSTLAYIPPLAIALGYLLGSIPFGIVLAKVAGATDPRTVGSGNLGATNMLRTGRKDLAALTLILDGLKGAVAVWLGIALGHAFGAATAADIGLAAGVAAFLGHLYPLWLKFRGGKGVATMLGVVASLSLVCGLVFAVIWVGVFAGLRYSSLAGCCAAIAAPVAAAATGRLDLTIGFLAMAMLVLWKHKDNIGRLLRGEEPRFGRPR